MTEGIIQKAFNEFRAKRLGNYITHEETLHLEQELIEKIKQIYKELEIIQRTCEDGAYTEGLFSTYEKIIGDNQE